ncbi:endolytic transglycosylase MltG [Nanchangia anserum]
MSDVDPHNASAKRYPPRRSRRRSDAEVDAPSQAHRADGAYEAADPVTSETPVTSSDEDTQVGIPQAVPAVAHEHVESERPHGEARPEGQPTPRRGIDRKRQRRRRTMILIAVAVAVVVAAIASIGYLGGLRSLVSGADDYEGRGSGEVSVTIPEGATGRDIAQILADADVVASPQAFENAYSSSSLAKGIQAGSYTLRKHMSASEALAMLLNPASKADLTITIPEGFTKAQVKDRLVSIGQFSADEVDKAMANTQALGIPAEANGNIEGWLAPDTYTIGPNESAESLLKTMVNLTIKRLDAAGVSPADRQAVLTKGSIIEREVNKDEYYPMVARVVENRLSDNPETHGLLQMDSTVLYGLGKTGGIPSRDDLAKDTPYNTYLHKGLPPSPIGAVGEKAIAAVMKPSAGNWMYYVTVNLETGETKFASTLDEQTKNTEELKRYCSSHPDVC